MLTFQLNMPESDGASELEAAATFVAVRGSTGPLSATWSRWQSSPRTPEDVVVPPSMVFAVRTPKAAANVLPEVRDAVAAVDPTLSLGRVRTLDQVLRRSMVRTSLATVVLLIAAGVALSLGQVGIYGVISYVTRLRTREIGLRIALGADGRAVRWMVLVTAPDSPCTESASGWWRRSESPV